jgi:hypothetical protein
MRSGQLNTPATILVMDHNLQATEIDWLWVSLRSKDGELPAAAGLRSPARVTIRSWWDDRLQEGRYLRTEDGRLLVIESARDPVGQRADIVLTCSELTGQPAEYQPQAGEPQACRVHMNYSAPWLDELGQVTDYRIRAEVALIEVGRPQQGDHLLVAGVLYQIIAYANDTDDGVVRGLWLDAVA